jgi:hypothetical protein
MAMEEKGAPRLMRHEKASADADAGTTDDRPHGSLLL